MEKIKLHYLVGDVHMGGHDVHRVAKVNRKLLDAAGAFDVTIVCDGPGLGDVCFDKYLSSGAVEQAQTIVFNCGNYRFNIPEEQHILEKAVFEGAGFVFLHGDHPCYWVEAGMQPWVELEKMAMLLWREETFHGDYGPCRVLLSGEEPITQGLSGFNTQDEIFCQMQNVQGVLCTPIAWAYSDPAVLSRYGQRGTGRNEVVAAVGRYGKGRTVNLALGHVWPYYTGHGLMENTLESLALKQIQQMFVRACEWAATGRVERTLNFEGVALLETP